MMQKFRKLSLESQLFFSFMAVSVCLLLLSLSITLSSAKAGNPSFFRPLSTFNSPFFFLY